MVKWLSGKKKILTMLLGLISGLAIAFGLDQGEISTIAGAVVSVFSVGGYLIAEGKIDVERIKNAAETVNDAVDVLNDTVVVHGFTVEDSDDVEDGDDAEGGDDDGE